MQSQQNTLSMFGYFQAEFISFISQKCLDSDKQKKGFIFWICVLQIFFFVCLPNVLGTVWRLVVKAVS